MSCKDVFTEEERKHIEEVLHGDLDGYYEEIKDVYIKDDGKSPGQEQDDNKLINDFKVWKELSNNISEKCNLNKWEIPDE